MHRHNQIYVDTYLAICRAAGANKLDAEKQLARVVGVRLSVVQRWAEKRPGRVMLQLDMDGGYLGRLIARSEDAADSEAA